MSIQVQHRRGTAAAHATFIGAPGEYTWEEDTKRVVGHDGATAGGIKMARLDEVTDEVQRAIGNADFSFQITDRMVVPNTAFTAPRTGTLPAANSVAAGRTISFFDALPAINGANVLTVARSGSDTINGAVSYTCSQPRGRWDFVSDGVSKWSVAVEEQPLDATLTALAGVSTSANKLIYATGADTFGTTDLTAFARTVLDDSDAATARTTLGAQASDATLTALAGVTTAANKLIYATGSDTFSTTDLTSYIRTLLAATGQDSALAAIGAAPLPVGSVGRGIWLPLTSATGAAAVLQSGGSYAYFVLGFVASTGVWAGEQAAGVAAGGATVTSAVAGWRWIGFQWNLS